MIQVLEEFRWLHPPANYRTTVERLLSYVPPRFLDGLDFVRLKDTSEFKDVWPVTRPGTAVRGLYRHPWKGRKAFIELHLDAITASFPTWFLKLPVLREILIGRTLFHEIGHHIQRAIEPDPRPPEVVANLWRDRLGALYLRRRYWFLHPVWRQVQWLLRALRRLGPALDNLSARRNRTPERRERRAKEAMASALYRRRHPPPAPSARAGSPRPRRRRK